MAKFNLGLGLDIDLFNLIEKLRGKTPRTTYINNTLRTALKDHLPDNDDPEGD